MASTFPNGFANGLSVRGMPITIAYPGQVFFVNNSGVLPKDCQGDSDGNPGTYLKPFSTLSAALNACTASRGDIVMVMPGHAETLTAATSLPLNKAGVCIVGMGEGDLRPTFTLGTVVGCTVAVSAANISIVNCLFKANLADVTSCFTTTTAKNFTISKCEFRDNSAILNFARIVDTNTTSNDTDGLTIEDCNWYGLGATANSCLVKMDGTNDRLTVRNCYVAHKAVTDAGLMPIAAGKVVTNANVEGNVFNLVSASAATTGLLITTNGSTNSGILRKNYIQALDATTPILVTASSGFIYMDNMYQSAADKSGAILPAIS